MLRKKSGLSKKCKFQTLSEVLPRLARLEHSSVESSSHTHDVFKSYCLLLFVAFVIASSLIRDSDSPFMTSLSAHLLQCVIMKVN